MNFGALLDATTAGALDVAWLANQLEPLSEPGRRANERIQPFRPHQEREAQAHADAIARTAKKLGAAEVHAMRDVLRTMPDPLPAIARAAMGEALEDANLLELLRFMDAAVRLQPHVPLDPQAREVLQILEPGRAGKFGFYLSEKFDAAL